MQLYELKARYPQIKKTMALSYIPEVKADYNYSFSLPKCFDDSVYLLERKVPKQYAIIETNKRLVEIADVIVAGVRADFGGAYTAVEYAYKRNKPIINLFNLRYN